MLNIAEGASLGRGASQVQHFRIAKGSAAETSAILDLLQPKNADDTQHKLQRVGAMLGAMTRT